MFASEPSFCVANFTTIIITSRSGAKRRNGSTDVWKVSAFWMLLSSKES